MGNLKWGPDQMFSDQRQRYQKNRKVSGQLPGTPKSVVVCMALTLGLAGCAGAEAPTRTAQQSKSAGANAPTGGAASASASTLYLNPPADVAAALPSPTSLVPAPVAEQALVDAREAMQKKQWTRLASLVPVAQAEPVLGSYAEYWWLRQQLQDSTTPVPTQQLQHFMSVNRDEYLADRIKGEWILAAARAGDYAAVNRLGPVVNSNAQIDCSRLMAQHMTGQKVDANDVMKAFQPGQACWGMLDQMYASKVVGWKQLQPELRSMLEENKTGHAQRMASVMFSTLDMVQYAAMMKNPRKWLEGRQPPATRSETEVTTLALGRLSRQGDRLDNAAYLEAKWANAVPKSSIEWAWSQFGLVAALNVEAGEAVRWYRRSGNDPMTDYNHAWQVRAELRQPRVDWKRVEKAIKRMSDRQQAEPVWTYWLGRAHAAQGDHETARKHFVATTPDDGFYGQLATEELGRRITIPPAPAPVTQQELAQVRADPGLQRALKLFDLGWRAEAVPEWNFSLRGMNDRQLLAAAELARHEQVFDRVVNTSLRTRDEVDFRQRFIAPFEGRVTEKARQINLDPAWVYGLIRQESRFITDARSRVGASGLMQLMPATAKWVARKIGMKDFTPSSVNDFDTNTVLGTNYLNMVLNDLDGSQVLATAGYNAGPRRPVQWRSKLEGPVEGAIFAETIPFTETRLYVKNVLSNAVYYAALFSGESQSLKERLGTIGPEPARQVALP